MENYQLFSLLGVVISGFAVALSIYQLRKKLNARERLIRKLAEDRAFLEEMKRLRESKNDEARYLREIERMQKIIELKLKELSDQERDQVEAPMHQSSSLGRARYIAKIARDVDLQIKHAA